ncbi:MAG: glucosaminidase domain-containing protein [Bacteroides sp.]|nr:glucosaminidase domain-containing protein [Roseburia sp.]MCM1347072.1 glucosaminidase domain-containing protein [Bacteroides sp.]MCM1420545.1 glucosaminidase domain-containing protein [Bacteroides sp.]
MNRKYILSVLPLIIASGLSAQVRKNESYQKYIEQYKGIAIEQMRKHHIPASITLAQGILESGAGSGQLALRSNNHFGIKCGSGWTGKTTRHNDDSPKECFRVYNSVKDSYEDHSKFLLRDRYKRLFALSPLDYKAWARGLKACGYATNPSYAERLISLIDTYELHQYDEDEYGMRAVTSTYEEVSFSAHQINKNNGVMYIVAKEYDTWESVAKEMSVSKRKLVRYNETSSSIPLLAGDIVYLEKKRKKADKKFGRKYWHKIKAGESMYSISQSYAINVASLYKMNFKDSGYVPVAGDLLRVR